MPYRLLALDLDGTLLDHRMQITPAVKAAVAAAQAQGVIVTIATGRTFRATMPYAEALELHGPLICYQGGAVFDSTTGAMTQPVALPGMLAAEGVQLMLDLGMFCLVYADEKLYIADETRPEFDFYMTFHPEGVDFVVAPDLVKTTQTLNPLKVQLTAPAEAIDQIVSRFTDTFAGRMDVLRAHDHFLELTPLGISKGRSLEALARSHGIPRERVVAIGDHFNDMEMILWAGLGLAMANGAPEVKAAADAVVPSVGEDGVAWAIQKYVLAMDEM